MSRNLSQIDRRSEFTWKHWLDLWHVVPCLYQMMQLVWFAKRETLWGDRRGPTWSCATTNHYQNNTSSNESNVIKHPRSKSSQSVHVCVHTFAHKYICVYIRMYVCICICTCICIDTHGYIHTGREYQAPLFEELEVVLLHVFLMYRACDNNRVFGCAVDIAGTIRNLETTKSFKPKATESATKRQTKKAINKAESFQNIQKHAR